MASWPVPPPAPRAVGLKQAGLVLLGVAAAVVMVFLGIWQLDVYRAQGERAAAARAAEPPVPLTSVASAGASVGDGFGRTVTFTGRYDPALQVVVRDPDGGPSRVLTGLLLADGSVLPVVRGALPDGGGEPPAPPVGTVTGSGILLPSESAPPGPNDRAGDPNTLVDVQLAALAQRWTPPLIPGFVILGADEARTEGLTPASAALPEADGRLRNAAYAVQWWVFAAFALAMGAKMARDVGRSRDFVEVSAEQETPAA